MRQLAAAPSGDAGSRQPAGGLNYVVETLGYQASHRTTNVGATSCSRDQGSANLSLLDGLKVLLKLLKPSIPTFQLCIFALDLTE